MTDSKQRQRDAICSHVMHQLHQERMRQKLSLHTVAERAGLSRQMVSFVEQERRHPTLDTLLRICDALGLQLEDVLSEARKVELISS